MPHVSTKWQRHRDFTDFGKSLLPLLQRHTGIAPIEVHIEPTVGREIALLVIDRGFTKKEYRALGAVHVELRCGLVPTEHGAVSALIFGLVAQHGSGVAHAVYSNEIDALDDVMTAPYEQLAAQSHWHVFVLGRGLATLDVLEFENTMDLGASLALLRTASKEAPVTDLAAAMNEAMSSMSVRELWDEIAAESAGGAAAPPEGGLAQGGFDAVTLVVPRGEIEANETGRVAGYIGGLSASEMMACGARGALALAIAGYDEDPRELFLIEEFRAWAHKLLSDLPDLFFFIDKRTARLLLLSTIGLKRARGGLSLDKKGYTQVMRFALSGINQRVAALGMDPEGAVGKAVSDRLLSALGG